MSSWYSAAGLKRGISMAGLGAALLIAWAIGYHQGVARRETRLGPEAIHFEPGSGPAIRPRQS